MLDIQAVDSGTMQRRVHVAKGSLSAALAARGRRKSSLSLVDRDCILVDRDRILHAGLVEFCC
jgi:hypothetical protein